MSQTAAARPPAQTLTGIKDTRYFRGEASADDDWYQTYRTTWFARPRRKAAGARAQPFAERTSRPGMADHFGFDLLLSAGTITRPKNNTLPRVLGLLDYAAIRLERCRFGMEKPVCAKCPVHCYQPARREQIIRT